MEKLDTSQMFRDGEPSGYLASLNKIFWLPFMQSLIRVLTENQPEDWYIDAILQEDLWLLNNEPTGGNKMILNAKKLSGVLQTAEEDLTEDCLTRVTIPSLQAVLDIADAAGYAKILTFRIPEFLVQRGPDRLKNLLFPFTKLRNVSSHPTANGSEDEKYLGMLTLLRRNLRNNSAEIARIAGADDAALQALLAEHLPQLDVLIDDMSLFIPERFSIKSDRKEPLEAKHLSFYPVIADEFALIQENSLFHLVKLLSVGRLFVFQSTVRALGEMASNAAKSKAELDNYRKILKILSDGEKTGRVTVLKTRFENNDTSEEILSENDNAAEDILAYAEKNGDDPLCVWTDSASLPERLYACGKPELAVVRSFERHSWIVVDPTRLSQTAELPDREPVQIAVPTIRFRTERPDPAPAPQSITIRPEAAYAPQPMAQPAYSAPFRMPKPRDRVYFDPNHQEYYTLSKELASGGEGVIFENEEEGGSYLFKIYKPERRTEERIRKITAMTEQKDIAENRQGLNICWPQNLLYDRKGRVIGYAMEPVRNAVSVREIVCTLLDGHYEKSSFPWTTRSDLVKLCIDIADGFRELHKLGNDAPGQRVLMGDVNPDNILVSKEKGTVWFIDVDSYQFREHNCPVGTPEFSSLRIVEEFKRRAREDDGTKREYGDIERTNTDEKFAMSILYYYILFPGQFPYQAGGGSMADRIREGKFVYANDNFGSAKYDYAWKNLTEEMRTMFRRTFGKVMGQAMRYYDDSDWSSAFKSLKLDIDGTGPGDHIRLSSRIWPTCCLQAPGETFREETCSYCKRLFEVPGNSVHHSNEACPDCKRHMPSHLATIFEKTCKDCGRRFSVNEFDLGQSDRCPDCDPNAHYTGMRDLEGPDAEKSLSRMLNYAVRNYLEARDYLEV